MTSLTKTIVAVTLLALLIYTNPTLEAYEEFIRKEIIQETRKQDGLSKVLGSLFGGFVSGLLANSTIRRDFIIFSFYDTDLGGERLKVFGVFNNFIVMRSLESERSFISNLQSTSKKTPLVQHEQTTQSMETKYSLTAAECVQVPYTTEQGFHKEDLSSLEEWAGRYPTQSFGNENNPNFFAVPQIERRLRHILSKADFKKVTLEYIVESPIELLDNYLLIHRCRPHECGENASIAVGLRDGSIFAVLTGSPNRESSSNKKRCFATNSDFAKLPENIQKRFLTP